MKDLAWRYWGHEGVEKDMDQCFAWYEKAIEAGDTEAMTTLAWLCWALGSCSASLPGMPL